jgi:hypothetical protein
MSQILFERLTKKDLRLRYEDDPDRIDSKTRKLWGAGRYEKNISKMGKKY